MGPIVRALLGALARAVFRFKKFGARSVIKPWPRRISGARYISIGEDCFFGDGLVLVATAELHGVRHQPECVIGNRCVFGSDTVISCTNSITIENNVLTSLRVFIGDSYHDYKDVTKPVLDQPMAGEAPIKIGEGSFLGIGCVILPGTTLGKGCYVGANAVVRGTYEDYTVISAERARPIRQYDPRERQWIRKV